LAADTATSRTSGRGSSPKSVDDKNIPRRDHLIGKISFHLFATVIQHHRLNTVAPAQAEFPDAFTCNGGTGRDGDFRKSGACRVVKHFQSTRFFYKFKTVIKTAGRKGTAAPIL
jgi:hypothetical protein